MPKRSNRQDGRGHWPPGKRRSPIVDAEQRRTIRRVMRAVEEYGSIRAVARRLRKSDRTVRRWLAGEDWPLPESVNSIRRALQ